VLWDKNALDVAADRLSGGAEPLVDPFTEAIKRQAAELRGRKGKGRK